jgi:predicted nucleic acid-binding protein
MPKYILDACALLALFNNEAIDSAIVREASHLKAEGKMSFADTILVATALRTGSTLVTCDHEELKPIEQQGQIPFLWIRPQF